MRPNNGTFPNPIGFQPMEYRFVMATICSLFFGRKKILLQDGWVTLIIKIPVVCLSPKTRFFRSKKVNFKHGIFGYQSNLAYFRHRNL
jgi:hypothetical protein